MHRAGVEGARTKIHTPLISMSKADIIKAGFDLGVDYSMTWSCYDPAAESTACGEVSVAFDVAWDYVGEDERTWFELLYMSFTTLTSVGMSDVTPVLDHARSLVMIEEVAGVLYIALVITRLVGLGRPRKVQTDES